MGGRDPLEEPTLRELAFDPTEQSRLVRPPAPRILLLSALAFACAREPEPSRGSEPAPRAKPAPAIATARPEASPAALVGMPGPIRPEEGFHHGSAPPDKPLKVMKATGKV